MLFPILPRPFVGKDTHAYIDNLFTSDELNKILALPNWLEASAAFVGGSSGEKEIKSDKRDSKVAWLYPTVENMFVWEKIAEAVSNINSRFFHYDLQGCYEPIQLGIYSQETNGHYDWHTDCGIGDTGVPRKLSVSITLSDPSEYEGGQLQLKTESDNAITVNTPRGRAWFFPSHTLHRVAPVTKGVRRSLVIWVGGPAFK